MTSKTGVVVGSTDGIGRAVVLKLLQRGWSVRGLSRRAATVEHPHYRHTVVDVRDAAYAEVLSKCAEGADWVLYCPGIGEPLDVDRDDSWAAEGDVFAVNLVGLVTTVATVIPQMLARGGGHFVGISSQADGFINPGAPSYSASKAGMSNYLEGVALAVRPRGVRVTNVRPGFVDTKMAKGPVRPFMLSADAVADRIVGTMKRRPVRLTLPWRMAALMWLVKLPTRLRAWWG